MTCEGFVKKLLLVLAAFALFSCASMQIGGDLRQTRDSVYKVRVNLTLDLTPLNEWKAKNGIDLQNHAGLQARPSIEFWGRPKALIGGVPISVDVMMEQTDFKVIGMTGDTATVGWSGTGWLAATAPGRSYIMTAGHVCESGETYDVEVWGAIQNSDGSSTFGTTTIPLPIIKKEHVMVARDGIQSANSTIIRDEDLDSGFNGNDLCVLGVTGRLGTPIPMADHDPRYGDVCSVVGAPTGLWGGGIAIASEALFSGRGSIFGTEPDGLAFNGLLAPGNSGSAVVCDGRAVGVISLGSTRFKSLTHAVPHERMRAFLDKALHRE